MSAAAAQRAPLRRGAWAWAMYDWANSAFATTVMAGFFPVFFKRYWSAGADVVHSTFQLGVANSAASVVVALAAPVLGAIADGGSAKKKFLLGFTAMGVVMTGALAFVARGQWLWAAVVYAGATIGFSGGNIFYDALLVVVAPPERTDVASSLGYALGYLGGGLLFAVNVAMTLWPHAFGLANAGQAVRLSFAMVALWWAVFSLPVLLLVHEGPARRPSAAGNSVRRGFSQLRETLRHVRQLRMVGLFLVAYWLYIDGVGTIIRMAVDYGMSLGFAAQSLIVALLITQFVGFPAAILFGKIGERIGTKIGIYIGIGVYIGVTVWGYFMHAVADFYGLAVAVGLVQGGIQALSRAYYARLIPAADAGEFFGFYNMLGKFAAVLGPALMGVVGLWTHSSRDAILSVVALFVGGAVVFFFVDEKRARAMLTTWEGGRAA